MQRLLGKEALVRDPYWALIEWTRRRIMKTMSAVEDWTHRARSYISASYGWERAGKELQEGFKKGVEKGMAMYNQGNKEEYVDGLKVVYRPERLPYVVKIKKQRKYNGADVGWNWVNMQAFDDLDDAQEAADELTCSHPNAEIVVVQR